MAQYLSPGVYVEETDQGNRPIEGVGTAIAAFVGFTEKGPREANLITNWEQYRSIYGDFIEGAYLPTSVHGYFLNGGTRAYVIRVSAALSLPQRGANRVSLEVTPLLSAGKPDDLISVKITDEAELNRYKMTIQRADYPPEHHDNLSSDPKDKADRYVETYVNKHSRLVRIYDASGNQAKLDLRSPKSGTYSSNPPQQSIKPTESEVPTPVLRLASRGGDGVPVMEIQTAPGVSTALSVEVADIPNQGELFRLIVKTTESSETENFEVSFKKGPQYLDTVVNSGRNASKLIRVKDLASDSPLSPSDRRPLPVQLSLPPNTGANKGKAAGGKQNVDLPTPVDFAGDVTDRTGVSGLSVLDDVTIVAMPDLMGAVARGDITPGYAQNIQTAMMNHCQAMHNRVAILDAPPNLTALQITQWRMNEANYDNNYAALYYPWIEIANPLEKGKTMFSPPSGHIAGIWARNDTERGVFKAPANEIVRGVLGLERQLTKGEQDGLNPVGINCIRAFPGRGIRVWGARTLSSDPAWRYLNVRRLFNFVEASIDRGTQWVVFEPNDFDLWMRIKRDISAFLYNVWLSGALFGQTPEQAYYVKCDEETNPPSIIDAGMVITEIGIAPVKPAEFVIFRIGQLVSGGE